jgi:hypothetical protein
MKKKDQKSKRPFYNHSRAVFFCPCFWVNLIRFLLFLRETDDALLFVFRSLFSEANDAWSRDARVILRV